MCLIPRIGKIIDVIKVDSACKNIIREIPHPMFNTPLSLMINMSFFKCRKKRRSLIQQILIFKGIWSYTLKQNLVENWTDKWINSHRRSYTNILCVIPPWIQINQANHANPNWWHWHISRFTSNARFLEMYLSAQGWSKKITFDHLRMIFIPLNALDEIEVNMILVKRYEFVVNA